MHSLLLFHPWIYRLLFISWAGTIFYLSSLSHIATPIVFHSQDKLIHTIAFGALAFFLAGSLQRTWLKRPTLKFVLICITITLYGISDEWHQSFTPDRYPDIFDVIADATGAILGAWIFHAISRRQV